MDIAACKDNCRHPHHLLDTYMYRAYFNRKHLPQLQSSSLTCYGSWISKRASTTADILTICWILRRFKTQICSNTCRRFNTVHSMFEQMSKIQQHKNQAGAHDALTHTTGMTFFTHRTLDNHLRKVQICAAWHVDFVKDALFFRCLNAKSVFRWHLEYNYPVRKPLTASHPACAIVVSDMTLFGLAQWLKWRGIDSCSKMSVSFCVA